MSPTLETLPPEILFNILSYTAPFSASLTPLHPLYTTAATSKHLCAIVEEYCRGLLKRHTNTAPPKAPKASSFVYRRKWVRWVSETCRYCGKSSKRRAILDASSTCCQKCDREHFPKMTMTAAVTQHGLSKLDLFTPNALHETLPPLNIGSYVCMGGDTVMLSKASVLQRKSYIHSLLGDKANDNSYLRRRIAAHDRIIQHMDITFKVGYSKVGWVKKYSFERQSEQDGPVKGPKSLRTLEGRQAYVKVGLERERAAMGMDTDIQIGRKTKGKSKETAITIE